MRVAELVFVYTADNGDTGGYLPMVGAPEAFDEQLTAWVHLEETTLGASPGEPGTDCGDPYLRVLRRRLPVG